jgi:MoxR-like ATPase
VSENTILDEIAAAGREIARIRGAIASVIVGQTDLVEDILACVLCGGHALVEGVPGLGKTRLIHVVGRLFDLETQRVQFTPDLMPADIIGTDTLVTDEIGAQQITFRPGPLFSHLLLADEINRATPKTQSALLEAMQERQVTVGGVSRPLGPPWIVLATENPRELEGTYPLPEAQLDRFFLQLRIGYPSADELVEILRRTTGPDELEPDPIMSHQRLVQLQRLVREIEAGESVMRYAVDLAWATHPDDARAPRIVRESVRYGASPRGAQSLLLAAKYYALVDGRAYASPDDVRRAIQPSLRHRIVPGYRAEAEGISVEEILAHLESEVAAPDAVR